MARTFPKITTGTAPASYAAIAGPLGGSTNATTLGEALVVNTHATLSLSLRVTSDAEAQAVITLAVGEQYRFSANQRTWDGTNNVVEVEEGTAACTYRSECDVVA